MIVKRIICDRCQKVVFDSGETPNLVDMMFGKTDGKELGYAEVNIIRVDGKCTETMHFCEECYEIAVKAWNENK